MSFLKNKFVLLVICAILIGGATGLYLSGLNKTKVSNTTLTTLETGTGAGAEKIGEVMKKLNDLTKE